MKSLLSFMYSKYSSRFPGSFVPCFDEGGLALFNAVIKTTSIYLEYGSGGSTVLASENTDLVVSVDSNLAYLNGVARTLGKSPAKAKCELIHADIGLTGAWGYPVFTKLTEDRCRRWKKYPKAPWEFLRQHGITPDTILIDGRFRVACSLESFLNLSKTSACRVLVDDYADRRWYRPIEQFGELLEMGGRMALFRRKLEIDELACREVLESFYRDCK